MVKENYRTNFLYLKKIVYNFSLDDILDMKSLQLLWIYR